MKAIRTIILFTVLTAGTCCCSFVVLAQLSTNNKPIIIKSPDRAIQLFVNKQNGKLGYSIYYDNKTIIEPSSLGILVNEKLIGENAITGKMQQQKVNEVYAYRGVHSMASNRYNGAIISYTGVFANEFFIYQNS